MPVTISLRRLFPRASLVGCADIRVAEVVADSRNCRPNTLFAVIRGSQASGFDFIGDAIERGASALLLDRPLAGFAVPQCIVPDVRKAYAELSSALAGNPSSQLRVAGVTGTNGKTTVTWMLRAILAAAGRRAGLVGTIENSDGCESQRSQLTTPDSRTLNQWLSRMYKRGATHAAIELSSHSLDQSRAAGVRLAAAVVTNITQDHFDYHGAFDVYQAAKAKIFGHCVPGSLAVVNVDCAGSRALAALVPGDVRLLTYGLEHAADLGAAIVHESLEGSRFVVSSATGDLEVATPLIGRHNVANSLAAIAVARDFGIADEHIVAGLAGLAAVPGRLERVNCGQPFDVFVDYAHTDDALRRCVSQLRHLTQGRVICVFGAGGDRDRSKRPLLGAAGAAADLAVVTSDNPRSESPVKIISDILAGMSGNAPPPIVEVDRECAIRAALRLAAPGDCVLVAGKGHETEQIIGAERLPFDDREVIRQLLTGPHWGRSARLERLGA